MIGLTNGSLCISLVGKGDQHEKSCHTSSDMVLVERARKTNTDEDGYDIQWLELQARIIRLEKVVIKLKNTRRSQSFQVK